MKARHQSRLNRHVTAMRNGKPDMVPIRPFVAELPDRSIIYHVDQGDITKTHRILGDRFCLSGGVSNVILAHGTPNDVRRRCKEVIDIAARDGGYIMDSSAIMQNDAKVENLKAMTDFTREYGVYSASGQRAFERPGSAATVSLKCAPETGHKKGRLTVMSMQPQPQPQLTREAIGDDSWKTLSRWDHEVGA